ncbi:hypothetical protein VM98_22960, partial [Streptomyces rubellomurinus subsp. indigoferus]
VSKRWRAVRASRMGGFLSQAASAVVGAIRAQTNLPMPPARGQQPQRVESSLTRNSPRPRSSQREAERRAGRPLPASWDLDAQEAVGEGEADLDAAVVGRVGVLDGVGEHLPEKELGHVGVAVPGGQGREVRTEQLPGEARRFEAGVEPRGERTGAGAAAGSEHGEVPKGKLCANGEACRATHFCCGAIRRSDATTRAREKGAVAR